MSKLMQKYVTVCMICQQLFYEIIDTNENNHKIRTNVIRRFFGMSLIFAYLVDHVNSFCRFCAGDSRLWTSGAVVLDRMGHQSVCLRCIRRGSNYLGLEWPTITGAKLSP